MRTILFIFSVNLILQAFVTKPTYCNEPDSTYLFAYTTSKNDNKNGLHFAWSIDKQNWHAIGPEHSFVKSDYGSWGSQKRMYSPFLIYAENKWHCVWSLNNTDGVMAYTTTEDLINWTPQSYLDVSNSNCLQPVILYKQAKDFYEFYWMSTDKKDTSYNWMMTRDFKEVIRLDKKITKFPQLRENVYINGQKETGTVHKVSWEVVDKLIKEDKLRKYKQQQNATNAKTDSLLFANLKPIEATITIDPSKSKKISDMLFGVFFEDINYAADGGLYAELIENRGFEYQLSDKLGGDDSWTSTKAWSTKGDKVELSIKTDSPIHPNNKHYASVITGKKGGSLINEGFDGIPVKKGETYLLSMFVRSLDNSIEDLKISLIDKNNNTLGETTISGIKTSWGKLESTITANKTVTDASLEIAISTKGKIDVDMVSLFPENTFNKHKNGLRPDLAQTIADLNPQFVRFPGGCVAHGNGLDNMYLWKNTIGPLEARKPQRNIWNYHQSVGLGYYEYFQFCEDINAEPIPIIPAAVPCQNSSIGGAGQQGGLPLSEMDDFIQDILDLVEWANGDASTTWGKKRAEAGHPEPFNLKYIGIGNEDLISDVFTERFTMIYERVTKAHPEITFIGTVGPFNEGSDYVAGWKLADKLEIPIVDEHYYQPPGWFIHNQDFYDKYDRSKSKVYLGEYASWGNTLYNALAEALYLTGIERNGDIVTMTSYAPLLAKERHTQWRTDLVFFNNTEIKPTPNYYVQQFYGNNAGDVYIPNLLTLSAENENIRNRIGVSVVEDDKNKDIIIKLVNMLPVNVNSTVETATLNITGEKAAGYILKGKPDDRKVNPTSVELTVEGDLKVELPPYSFMVLKIKK